MANHNLTYAFGNNFENENSSAAISIPAKIRGEGARGTSPAVFIAAGDTVTTLSIPANVIIQNFYLIVESPMAGNITADINGTEVFPSTPVVTEGAYLSDLFDVYTTTPYDLNVTFDAAQTEGSIKIAYNFIQLDTNTAKYLNE